MSWFSRNSTAHGYGADSASPRRWFRSASRSWSLPAALGLLFLVCLLAWAAPRRTEDLVSVEGDRRWSSTNAPLRRQIVWDAPRVLEELAPAGSEPGRLIAPRLADGGQTLYFSQRLGNRQADIYRSRLMGGKWQTPEAVVELNSSGDDLGAAISPDGTWLCFASNRPGGAGGFDLYLSQRSPMGWSAPINLGRTVNSTADEIDPAWDFQKESAALVFASNLGADKLKPRVASRNGESNADLTDSTWTTTLRAQGKVPQFDLYRSERKTSATQFPAAGAPLPGDDWSPPEALAGLNRSTSNEGAPWVSPGGAFLYFASDRSVRRGEAPNLDLFRARWTGSRYADAENLGPGINTPHMESEPGLSSEGFTLVFSSDRQGFDELYLSPAREVYAERGWDTARWQALSGVWWRALFAAVLAGLAFAAMWHGYQWAFQNAGATRFFVAAILFHVGLVFLLWLTPLGTMVMEVVEEVRIQADQLQLFDDNLHQSHDPGSEAYEKVADLRSLEAVDIPDTVRQVTDMPNVPAPREIEKLVPTVPVQVARALPQERVLFVPPQDPIAVRMPQEVKRQSAVALATLPRDPEALATPAPRELPREAAVADLKVELARSAVAAAAPAPEIPRQTVEAAPRLRSAPLLEDKPQEPVRVAIANEPRMRRSGAPLREMVEPVDLSTLLPVPPGSAPQAESAPAAPDVVVLRNEVPAAVTASANAPVPVTELRALPATPVAQAPEMARLTAVGSVPRQTAPPVLKDVTPDETAPTATPVPAESTLATTEITPQRGDPLRVEIDVKVPDELAGPRTLQSPRIVVGSVSNQNDLTAPSFSPLANTITRMPAKAVRVAYAEDNVGIRAMFTLRQGDNRRQFIDLFGGNEATEAAVNRGLTWLALHQDQAGSWSLNNFHANCAGKHANCPGAGAMASNVAATGVALLPFLAAGHTSKEGEYREVVTRALDWLIAQQKPDGQLLAPGDGQPMYSHGLATIALCEAFGMTQDEKLQGPAQRAVQFIEKSQNAATGGWRYNPGEPGDTSVVGWQVMALKSGEMAGLAVSAATLDGARRWLASVEGNQPVGGQFGYQSAAPTPTMTAEGLLCLQFLGVKRNDPRLLAGADYILKNPPDRSNTASTSYYWYYATQAMYHMQGEYWTTWNEKLRDGAVQSQIAQGDQSGTWAPRDSWEQSGGRVFSTAMHLLMLEIYYRHLPLYQQVGE